MVETRIERMRRAKGQALRNKIEVGMCVYGQDDPRLRNLIKERRKKFDAGGGNRTHTLVAKDWILTQVRARTLITPISI
jgi:hypothetical protein